LPESERLDFLKEMGLTESGLVRLTREAYQLLNIVTFFTAGEIESRAWPIPKNMKAPQAAGKIHSDMERGFIRAEVYHYDDLMACGSEAKVKEKGLKKAPNFVLSSSKSSTYPRGYASGFNSPAASLDGLFEQPVGTHVLLLPFPQSLAGFPLLR
jgi:hypothetical protein